MAPWFDWWAKETTRGTPMVVKIENPNNWSMVELKAPLEDDFLPHSGGGSTPDHCRDKTQNKNAKQFTWVLLLKAHRAVG